MNDSVPRLKKDDEEGKRGNTDTDRHRATNENDAALLDKESDELALPPDVLVRVIGPKELQGGVLPSTRLAIGTTIDVDPVAVRDHLLRERDRMCKARRGSARKMSTARDVRAVSAASADAWVVPRIDPGVGRRPDLGGRVGALPGRLSVARWYRNVVPLRYADNDPRPCVR
ncbi:MAG TPA: hypothetical protein VK669_09055 [Candidatus Limnocylindrales bacterium]|nr:hypothetical protein [Candidatus Limnocylindrales bacterium]